MPHAFDLSGLTHLVGGLKVVAGRAREHEYQLTELVSSTEATTLSALASPTSDAVAGTGTGIHVMPPLDSMQPARLMMTLRELCVAARDQRLRAEQLVANVGGRIDDGGTGPSDHNVLVVDDSEDSRELAATVLDGAGFRVLTATNGLEAIIAAHVTLPSAILMDITMPVLNGIEAARLQGESGHTRYPRTRVYRDRGVLRRSSQPLLHRCAGETCPPGRDRAAVASSDIRPTERRLANATSPAGTYKC